MRISDQGGLLGRTELRTDPPQDTTLPRKRAYQRGQSHESGHQDELASQIDGAFKSAQSPIGSLGSVRSTPRQSRRVSAALVTQDVNC